MAHIWIRNRSAKDDSPRTRPMTAPCPICGHAVSVADGRGATTTMRQQLWLHMQQEHAQELRNRSRGPRIY